ncbi:MAG: SDR family NAD(P)-dependent oxidoreductase [Pseudomonadota bacterium]
MAGVIVTGGFGILGRAVAAELTSQGHAVAAVDMAPAPADIEVALAVGGIDLGDEAAVASAYKDIASRLGGISGLVNVAGGFLWETVSGGEVASWDRMYQLNVRTAFLSSRAALDYLGEGGAIVNVGAAAALSPASGMAPYTASKLGVHALTESLANELRDKGIRVNAVLPTILDTPANRADMPDADRSGWVLPQAAARVIAFLLSDESASITGAKIPLSLRG